MSGQTLFSSESKFKPVSDDQAIHNHAAEEESHRCYRIIRSQVYCSNCAGHLGHISNGDSKPTGLRYYINPISLNLIPNKI